VKQNNLVEYEKKYKSKVKDTSVQGKSQVPLKPSHMDGKRQAPPPPPQRSKTRRIEGFGENIDQLSLCVNKLHLYLSLLNMVSQKVVSHFDVFDSPMENCVMG
jgi:hypothetical protein